MELPEKNKWVDVLLQEITEGKKYKRLIQKCINNMGEHTKLYKYFDLNSPYTLSNIENSENYYNNPTDFNDPFDCNIGISADQLIKLCLPDLYDRLFDTSLDPKTRTIIDTLLFGDSVTYDEGSDQEILSAFIESPDLADIIYRIQSGEEIDNSVIANTLINNPNALSVLLSKHPALEETELNENLAEQIKLIALRSTTFVRQIVSNASANQAEELQPIFSIMGENDDFLRRIQKLAKLLGYDVQDNQIQAFYDQLEILVKQLHTIIGQSFGITCFSETPYNMLMWSHYANKHTGICVEYDFSNLFSTAADTLLLPVTYSPKRPLLPVDKFPIGSDGALAKDPPLTAEILSKIINAITIKSDLWSYEREWRHIVSAKAVPNRLVKLPIISKIILGMNISPENKERVLALARKKQIPVYSTHMKSDKYEMVIANQPE